MGKKQESLNVLRVVLANKKLSSQKEILEELRAAGHQVSQPTLSLYMRELRVSRVRTRDGVQYVLPPETDYTRVVGEGFASEYLHQASILRVAFSENMLILRTKPAYAAFLAAQLDAHELPSVAGTIAGFDTICIAKVEGATRQQLVDDIAVYIPALKSALL
ncbi:MAG: ArgR family transcriptional regulator [Alloprevotella sp.]|nr:ArgR family transcriptional regulator [Alloprevotella sp.]